MEYPVLSFRLKEEEKAEITKIVNSIKEKTNLDNNSEFYKTKKTDIYVEALEIGLNKILKG